MGSPYPRVAAFAFLLLIFNIAYAAPLVVPNALPASQTIMQGNTATMTVATPTGGAKPYTYQWLEISPGNSLFANAINCAAPTTLTCSFSTTLSTPTGLYSFKLHVTDKNALTADSSVAAVTLNAPPTTTSTSTSSTTSTIGSSSTTLTTTSTSSTTTQATSSSTVPAPTTTVEVGGGGGGSACSSCPTPSSGGGVVGSGGASSVVSEVTSTFGAAILVSGLPQYSTANLIFHEVSFNITVSFVNPGAANILVNGVEYVITPNNQTLILRTPVHSFFLLPTNFTLTPNQDKISFLLYHVATNATGTLIVSNSIPVNLALTNQSTLNVSIEEFEGLLGIRSNIPGNFVLSVSNNTSGAPPIPVGYQADLVMNLSLRSLTPGARATSNITLGYNCVNPKNLSVPFVALNGSWSQINDYVRNTTSCIISFVIPADPIVSLMHQVKTAATTSITTTASTTIIQVQPSGPTEPGVSYYLTLIVALVLFIIYYNWRLKGAKSRKFKGSASIPVVNRQEVVFLNSVFFVLGFTFVFASLGTLFQTILAHTAFALMNALRIAGGVVIVLFGMLLIASVKYIIPFFSVEHRIKVKRFSSTYLTSFVFGVAFAIGWTPCVGAILGAIYTLAATSPGIGFLLLLSFALGLGIPFLIVGAFTSRLYGFVHRIKGFLKYFNIISGLFLIAIGILVITNYIGIISVFLVGPQGPMSISENINFLLAIIAGMLTFLSPCILPLLPAFFSYMAGTTAEAAKHEN